MRCHTQWFSEQHHDSCGFVSFRLRLRGSPPRHLCSRDPLLSVFVFGFSIILHGFEFVTNNDNKKENNNIGKIEEVGLVCCWKRRIGFEFFWVFEWDGYVRKWRKNGGVAISHTLQSDWISVLSQTLLRSRRSPSQKLQICSHF